MEKLKAKYYERMAKKKEVPKDPDNEKAKPKRKTISSILRKFKSSPDHSSQGKRNKQEMSEELQIKSRLATFSQSSNLPVWAAERLQQIVIQERTKRKQESELDQFKQQVLDTHKSKSFAVTGRRPSAAPREDDLIDTPYPWARQMISVPLQDIDNTGHLTTKTSTPTLILTDLKNEGESSTKAKIRSSMEATPSEIVSKPASLSTKVQTHQQKPSAKKTTSVNESSRSTQSDGIGLETSDLPPEPIVVSEAKVTKSKGIKGTLLQKFHIHPVKSDVKEKTKESKKQKSISENELKSTPTEQTASNEDWDLGVMGDIGSLVDMIFQQEFDSTASTTSTPSTTQSVKQSSQAQPKAVLGQKAWDIDHSKATQQNTFKNLAITMVSPDDKKAEKKEKGLKIFPKLTFNEKVSSKNFNYEPGIPEGKVYEERLKFSVN